MGAIGAILISFYLSLFGFTYASGLAPQCDTTASQRHKLTQEHCDLVLASFDNYGNWVLNPKPVASQSCRRCEIVVESLTQYGIRAPIDVIKYGIYTVLNSCGARGGYVQLAAGTGETFGPYPKMLVRVRQGDKGSCPAARTPGNGDDDDDDDDDDFGSNGNGTGSGFGGGSRSGSRGGSGSGFGQDSGSGFGGGSRSGFGGDSGTSRPDGRGTGFGQDSGGRGRSAFNNDQSDDTDDTDDTNGTGFGTTATPRTRTPQGTGGTSRTNQRAGAQQQAAAPQGVVPALTSGLKGLLG